MLAHNHHPEDILTAALAWHGAGCSVIRAATDGTKRPLGDWKHHQTTRASPDTLRAWFAGGHPGIGVVTGAVSGHLELLELEGRAVADGLAGRFFGALDAHGELRHRLAGYAEVSPSGGYHLFYRVQGGVGGNTKLARRRGDPDPTTARPTIDVLIETRGEGGFVVVAPSHGAVHPTSKPWRATPDSAPASIPTITAEERDTLHAIAASLDELPPPEPVPDPIALERRDPGGGLPPGADFTTRGTWAEILDPAGWVLVRHLGDRAYWRRPGKNLGISAVTGGREGDYFYCWSTSTELPSEQAMSKWRLYAHLYHGGDFHAAASALRGKGYGAPRNEPQRPILTVLPSPNTTTNPAPSPDAPVESTYERSDDGNALLLIDRFGAHLRFCPDRGRWLTWTGTRWQWTPSSGGMVREYAKRISRALPDGTDTETKRWKQRSLSALGVTNMLIQAATDPRITVDLGYLDARPYELNTPAGILDLITGVLRPADPAALHTRITAYAPDPDVDATRWHQFLADTFTGHNELPIYLQRLVGYSVTGIVREHLLPFAFGGGANGKGVFLETLRAVLGDYATTAPSGFLMARNYASHETEIARLAGARMVVCSEINETDKFDEAKVKQLTGGDTLTARFMRMDHFTFTPSHKLWLMGNHQPTVNGGGHSFWRRLRILPFDNTVPKERQVDDLQTILATQYGPAVLAWIVAGARDYFAGGLAEPDSVRVATAEYEHSQDTVTRFIEDRCYLGGGSELVRIRTDVLRAAYDRWCLAECVTPVSATTFGITLRNRFAVPVGKSNGRKFYLGLALAAADDDTDSRKDLA